MTVRTGWSVLASFLLLGCWMTATAQQVYGPPRSNPPQPPPQRPPVARPTPYPPPYQTQRTGPAMPPPQSRGPAVPQRGAAPQASPAHAAPFVLTPQQQADVDHVLRTWEQRGAAVQRFECDFVRYVYKPAMAQFADSPNFRDRTRPFRVVEGEFKFAAPDKLRMEVIGELVGGDWANGQLKNARLVKGQRPELRICDGRSFSDFDFAQKVLRQYVLPPEMRGQALGEGPLPFLFNTTAANLKARYFIRIMATPTARQPTWRLEAWPRTQRGAAAFFKVDIFLDDKSMLPYAIQLHEPQLQQTNEGNRTVYLLENTKVNKSNPRDFLKDPFKASKPSGWTLQIETPPTQQARRPGTPGGAR